MEEKNLVVGIFIGLVFGGIIGYIVAPKSNTIKVSNPQLETEPVQTKTQEWKTLKTWKGTSSKETETFYISGESRIGWAMKPLGQIILVIHSEKPSVYGITQVKYWTLTDESGVTYTHLEPGRYYLEINAFDCYYIITVETEG